MPSEKGDLDISDLLAKSDCDFFSDEVWSLKL